MERSGAVIGITVGNAQARAAVWESGKARITPLEEGERSMPSAALLHRMREVGKYAYLYSGTDPNLLVTSINRLLGRSYAELAEELKSASFEAVNDQNRVRIAGQLGDLYAPIELYAMVLRKLRQSAERYLGKPVTDAVIAVPGSFDDFQRRSARTAAESVFRQVKLINEPAAAALAMNDEGLLQFGRNLMTFDMGAGKCEAAIVQRTRQNRLRVKSIAGDTHLGGDDIDNLIFNFISEEFQRTFGESMIGESAMAKHEVMMAVREAKSQLEKVEVAFLGVPFVNFDRFGNPLHLFRSLDRSTVERLCAELIVRAKRLIAKCKSDSNHSTVSNVLLLGGSTKLPFVERLVADASGQTPVRADNPDELAALGACLYGAKLRGQWAGPDIEDVTAHSLGITTYTGNMGFVLRRQSTIPMSTTKRFVTVEENQKEAHIEVREGEEEHASRNRVIGEFMLPLAPRLPRGSPIDVTIGKDEDGIVLVRAQDHASGRTREIAITYDL